MYFPQCFIKQHCSYMTPFQLHGFPICGDYCLTVKTSTLSELAYFRIFEVMQSSPILTYLVIYDNLEFCLSKCQLLDFGPKDGEQNG